ncbi:MAG: IPT/TIG domain-containing protein, partial [Candidatus Komeilibacteria bacterium]
MMNWRKSLFIFGLILIGGAVLLPVLAQAQASLDIPSSFGNLGSQDLKVTIGNIVQIAIGFLGILLILYLLYGGFIWMTSGGNEDKIDQAKRIIVSAVVGLVLVLASFAIATFIISNLQKAVSPGTGTGTGGGGGGGGCPSCPTSCDDPGDGSIKVCPLAASVGVNSNLTITGYNFGAFAAAGSKVQFIGTDTAEGIIVQCSGTPKWSDHSITVIVPEVGAGPYTVKVINGPKSCSGLNCGSTSVSATASPSINCISPDSGPGGTAVKITGKNFGSTKSDVELQGASTRFKVGAANISTWSTDEINFTVPASAPGPALSGDIKVDKSGSLSNGEYFTVTCAADSDCVSNCCRSNSCRLASVCTSGTSGGPVIDRLTPNNGESGNYVTISGRNFGAFDLTKSKVNFFFEPTATKYSINTFPAAACGSTWWSDKQIIIAVPPSIAATVNGNATVTVITGVGESSGINFAVNDIVRPGLCLIDPTTGSVADSVDLTGNNFTGASRSVEFGGISGDGATFAAAGTGASSKVPNIKPAKIGVTVKVGSESSNPLAFEVVATGSGPHILYITPDSGPSGEYIHINGSGFGSKLGTVKFVKGADTFVGDTSFPAACLSGTWSDTHIVVKVPSDVLATAGSYEVYVSPIGKADSNKVAFTKTSGTAGPGVCLLNPNRGPVNTAVNFYGERFGSTAGTVTFFENKDAGPASSWASSQVIGAKVPVGAKTGNVSLKTSGGLVSSGIPFEVGSCKKDSECPAGNKCCSDGTCKTACAVAGPSCKYVWTFTTGERRFDLVVTPPGVCPAEGPSPAPYLNSTSVPLDAVIAARFTAAINFGSVADSVTVHECNHSGSLDMTSCTTAVNGNFSRWAGNRGFIFESSDLLKAGTWYQVELNSGSHYILAEDGSRFPGDAPGLVDGTKWYFQANTSITSHCVIDKVAVSPSSQIIYLGNEGKYSAMGLDSTSCTLCRSSAATWNWSISDSSLADLVSSANQLTVKADKDKTSETASVAATTGGHSKDAGLIIRAGDPFVSSFSPAASCLSACTNAVVTAKFNLDMKNTTDADKATLYKCPDSNCNDTALMVAVSTVASYDSATRQLTLTPSALLPGNSWYRVIIKNTVQSIYDTKLAKLNFPVESPVSFSWKFKTGGTSCTPDAVIVSPGEAEVLSGSNVNFSARPIVNTLPLCSVINLDPKDYAFEWTSSNPPAASVADTGQYLTTAQAIAPGPIDVNITAALSSAYPLATPGVGLLKIVVSGGGTGGTHLPLQYIGHTPSTSPVCRNALVSAIFNNKLADAGVATINFFTVDCGSVTCPLGHGVVQGNKVVFRFNNPADAWPASATVKISLVHGARDIYGQTWSGGGENWTFATTNDLCLTSYVTVDPPTYTFTAKNQSEDFIAQAFDRTGIAIAGATYTWTQKTGPVIQVPPLTGVDSAGQDNDISSKDKNGVDYAFVKAKGPADTVWTSGYARVAVDFCENPWTLQPGPYIDTQYDFAVNYCHDSIRPGSDDLPDLSAPVVRNGSGDLLKEHVFVVNLERSAAGSINVSDTQAAFETEPSSATATVGGLLNLRIKAKDIDGDQFVLAAASLPDGASFNPYSGSFTWVPLAAGSYNATFILRQPPYADQTKTVGITVAATPGALVAPVVTMSSPVQGSTVATTVGSSSDFTALLTSGSARTYVWDFQDSGPTSNYVNSGSSFSARHKFIQRGPHQVTLRVQDTNGLWSQPAVVNVNVQGATSFNWGNVRSWWQSLTELFSSAVAWAQTPATGTSYDVIVIRVMKNLEHLSPLDWYHKYAPNPTGNPSTTIVNGYPAIQDGTTTYVAAANVFDGTTVYTNMYLLSYNANAQATTKKLVQQLLKNWKFNYSQYLAGETDDFSSHLSRCNSVADATPCTLDSDCKTGEFCPSILASLRRDVQRYTDIHSVARSLQEYATSHKFCQNAPERSCVASSQCPSGGSCVGFYPTLPAGSYIRGMSTSKWPSWQETLGTVMGDVTLPTDPINRFGDCGGASYNSETCWDATALKFSCPANSPVYIYQLKGGASYNVYAGLETTSDYSWPLENNNIKLSTSEVCTSEPQGAFCGDGTINGTEVCDGGFHLACPTGAHNQATVGCKPDCRGWYELSGWTCSGSCGDGNLDSTYEQCEAGGPSLSGWNCTNGGTISCGGQCRFQCNHGTPYAGKCGTGGVELPEVCDDGSLNGSYGHCNVTCSGYGEYCGDGIVNGTEECDTYAGLANFSCADGGAVSCTGDCKHSCGVRIAVKPGICGNRKVETEIGEQCEPDLYLTPSANASSADNQYSCGETNARKHCSNDPTIVCDQDIQCSGGSCQDVACRKTGGWCGDNIKEIPFETCDLGSANSDRCNNMTAACSYCSKGCRQSNLQKNFCGDGILNIGPDMLLATADDLEKCDDGSNNGLLGFCDNTCQTPGVRDGKCGDGLSQWPWETCDEGTGVNGTPGHCGNDCRSTVPLTATCGNGTPEAGEVCDDGPDNGTHNHCNEYCSGYYPAVCGNTFIEDAPYGSEKCDDGNVASGDGCSSTCQIETPGGGGSKVCGDSNIDKPNDAGLTEFCDDGVANNGQKEKCWTDCTRLTKYCGDTQTQTPNDFGVTEICDQGALNGTAVGKCNTSCTGYVAQICKDHQITGTETCDLCPASTTTYCKNPGGSTALASGESCNSTTCMLNTVVSVCNNGTVEGGGGERCDFGIAACNAAGAMKNCYSPSDLFWCLDVCRLPCGDGEFDPTHPYGGPIGTEICDDGTTNGTVMGGCGSLCLSKVNQICGDTLVTGAETCDDGPYTGQDGYCGPLEYSMYPGAKGIRDNAASWVTMSICNDCSKVVCGDGKKSGTCNPAYPSSKKETCDWGDPATRNCNKWCTGICGNGGTPDPGETCDDGALNGTPGHCKTDCSGMMAVVCGDGDKASSEFCDYGSGSQNISCTAASPTGPLGRCCWNCNRICGDGSYDGVLEKCDEGVALNGSGPGHCNQFCTGIMPAPSCGDGAINGTEQCDGTLLNGATCLSLGYYGPGSVSCYPPSAPAAQRCTYNITSCQRCGDNLINGGEVCDGTNLNGQTCATLGLGVGMPTCNSNCTFNTSTCSGPSTCGDGDKTGAEACDFGPDSVTKDFSYESCTIAGLPGIRN